MLLPRKRASLTGDGKTGHSYSVRTVCQSYSQFVHNIKLGIAGEYGALLENKLEITGIY